MKEKMMNVDFSCKQTKQRPTSAAVRDRWCLGGGLKKQEAAAPVVWWGTWSREQLEEKYQSAMLPESPVEWWGLVFSMVERGCRIHVTLQQRVIGVLGHIWFVLGNDGHWRVDLCDQEDYVVHTMQDVWDAMSIALEAREPQ